MKKKLVYGAMLMGMTAAMFGTSVHAAEEAETKVIVDSEGREVEVPAQIDRVVCTAVGSLRYTCYMGAQDRVVGVEEHEKEASIKRLYNYVNIDKFKDLPVIGGMDEPDAESIIAADPQVIVMGDYIDIADELQEKTGIPVVVVPYNSDGLTEDTYETIDILGELYGLEDRADELTDYLKGVEEDLDKRTADIPEEEKPSVYVGGLSFKGAHGFNGTEPFYSPFELINANNLVNSTGQTNSFEIDYEQVLKWDPEIIFLDFNGMEMIKENYAENPDYYNSLSAVKNDKVYSQISFRACASNLEMAIADAYYAGSVVYPDRFEDVDIDEKTREIFTTILGADPLDDLKEEGYEFRSIKLGE